MIIVSACVVCIHLHLLSYCEATVTTFNMEASDRMEAASPGPGPRAGGYFGDQVAMTQNGAFVAASSVGARCNTSSVLICGAIYAGTIEKTGSVYRFNNRQTVYGTSGVQSADRFGESMAINYNGFNMAVGAPGPSIASPTLKGKVYVYTTVDIRNPSYSSQGVRSEPLLTSAGARFGASVAFSGNGYWLAVGAPNDKTNSSDGQANGAVFLYNVDGIGTIVKRQKKLFIATSGTGFGSVVAMNLVGSILLVGAPVQGGHGQVHSYKRDDATGTVTYEGILPRISWPAVPNQQFGVSIGLSADGVFGAVGMDSAATIYRRVNGNTWVFVEALYLPCGETGVINDVNFAPTDTSFLVLGVKSVAEGAAQNVGAAYVYQKPLTVNTYNAIAKATPSSTPGAVIKDRSNSFIGGSVALAMDGDSPTVFIGAGGDNGTAGAAYGFYTKDTVISCSTDKSTPIVWTVLGIVAASCAALCCIGYAGRSYWRKRTGLDPPSRSASSKSVDGAHADDFTSYGPNAAATPSQKPSRSRRKQNSRRSGRDNFSNGNESDSYNEHDDFTSSNRVPPSSSTSTAAIAGAKRSVTMSSLPNSDSWQSSVVTGSARPAAAAAAASSSEVQLQPMASKPTTAAGADAGTGVRQSAFKTRMMARRRKERQEAAAAAAAGSRNTSTKFGRSKTSIR
jgi:FG-GAP repeat